MKRFRLLLPVAVILAAASLLHALPARAQQQPIYCNAATLSACNTSTNPGNGSQGDPAYLAFGKVNANIAQLYGMFGAGSVLKMTGTASYTDIAGLFTGCSGSNVVPNLLTGMCVATSGGGGPPGGASYSFQYNDAGSFGGILPGSTGYYCLYWSSLSGAPALSSSSLCPGGTGSMTWPSGGAGIPNYSGSDNWGTSYSASNQIPDGFVGGLAGSPMNGEFWGYNGSAQGWYTPTGSGTVNSGTEGDFAYYATTGTAVSPLSPAAVQAALVAANAISYTPTLASGATNDWDPSGGAGITTVGVAWTTPNSAGSTVDGILAGSATQQIKLCNAATLGTNGSYIILENQDSSDSTAANRLMGAGNQALGPQMCVMLTYLAGTVDRWEMGRIEDAGTPATQPLATGTSMTPDCSFKTVTETASAAGTFTINAPTDCTPQNGQRIELDVTNYSGSASTLSWNSTYMASSTLALPTAGSAAADEDDFVFGWSAALSKWKLLAYNQGF